MVRTRKFVGVLFQLALALGRKNDSINGHCFIALGRSQIHPLEGPPESSTHIGEKKISSARSERLTSGRDFSSLSSQTSCNVQKHLEAAHQDGSKLRWRITLCILILSIVPLTILLTLGFAITHGVLSTKTFGLGSYYLGSGFWFIPVLALALCPTDGIRIRSISVLSAAVYGFMAIVFVQKLAKSFSGELEAPYSIDDSISYICGHGAPSSGCLVAKIDMLTATGTNFFMCCVFGSLLIKVEGASFYDWNRQKSFRYCDCAFQVPARRGLARIWFALRVWFFFIGAKYLIRGLIFHLYPNTFPWYDDDAFKGDMFMAISWCMNSIIFNQKRRGQIMSFLLTIIQHEDEARSASIIAALIGNNDPTKCLHLAKEHFCAIEFQKLTKEDFANNTEKEGNENALHKQTKPIKLGKCDAFISHSWRDDGDKKFHALCIWAETFEKKNGRPPIVWLDKACIDQTNISNDLLCLPIFLAGCDTLLVIAGPSYITRLWCVIELFTFLKMGGNTERITVIPIDVNEEQDPHTMFQDVDVSQSECAVEQDRQRLLGIVERGFGNFDAFNEILRDVFCERVSRVRSRNGSLQSPQNKVQPAKQ